jgi:flagellar L-ring protein precursor FlgH
VVISAGGCANFDRLAEVGRPPVLSAVESPVTRSGYKPVRMPMPALEPAVYEPNSLWRSGARSFFKDQRAMKVGDILTVIVEITDKAEIDNQTSRSRKNSEDMGIDALGGYASKISNILPHKANPADLINFDSEASSTGAGSVNRQEKLVTQMAAVVTQKLPNGNLVIEGKQEVRVNYEVRELVVAGVVRPEDISADNTIPIAKIAEARVSYGGRGQISDVQQPRYGQQVLDIILPF